MDHMDFREIGKLVSEDRFSPEYLWKKRGNILHPSRSSSEFSYHQRWRVRCKGCKKEYWPLQGTRFALLRISPSQWLSLMKSFELSTSARKASQEVYLSYKTTLRAYDILRRVLVEELAKTDDILKGELEADEANFGGKKKGKRGRGAGGKTIVYGILERGGEGLGEYCSGCLCRESYDRDSEAGEERLHRIHRQVAGIGFSHVLWLQASQYRPSL